MGSGNTAPLKHQQTPTPPGGEGCPHLRDDRACLALHGPSLEAFILLGQDARQCLQNARGQIEIKSQVKLPNCESIRTVVQVAQGRCRISLVGGLLAGAGWDGLGMAPPASGQRLA